MAQSHTWFATIADARLVLSWLDQAGAVSVAGGLSELDIAADGREFVLHFPAIGPLEFWPDQIEPSEFPEHSARWRQAILMRDRQSSSPGRRWIDADRSATAGIQMPEFRDNLYWVSGCVWFPGSRLRQTFPELARVCQRFERWIRRFPTVFDNTKGEDSSSFSGQLCMGGIIQRVVALPEAFRLLGQGNFMIDHMTSPACYADFRRGLLRRGVEPT
jgi:hypothetical protein